MTTLAEFIAKFDLTLASSNPGIGAALNELYALSRNPNAVKLRDLINTIAQRSTPIEVKTRLVGSSGNFTAGSITIGDTPSKFVNTSGILIAEPLWRTILHELIRTHAARCEASR